MGLDIIDPRVSIWMSVDPMMEKYAYINPYVYCIENPVNVIDPDGKDIIFILMKTQDGVGGHAGIAISNYVKDKKGNYVSDGTYNYYSFVPTQPLGAANYRDTVKGEVSVSKNVTMEQILYGHPDIADNDKMVTGVIKINTSKAYDDKVKKEFEDKDKAENNYYNLITNNCTTFCSRALTNKDKGQESVKELDGQTRVLYTENKMFTDLAKSKGTEVLLRPGPEVNTTAQKRYNNEVKQKTAHGKENKNMPNMSFNNFKFWCMQTESRESNLCYRYLYK